ncbi:DUF4198 domain-containing protein [Sphingomonas suaedae]|uniref:DUF4198 domain-containing protein n=1 Tax=Sphingomonas suaedae TaxID=2599297 RepID=A0A518RJA1_9SPHN|nr:DUF4198 domain-containing protein [Sphingomonas suaedae]QDX27538.1 DUF4198 domain-containing protein [Sphingomonas suaedae]
MMRYWIAALAIALTATNAQAHELWAERGANDKLQVWLGEPEKPIPAGGDPAFPSLKSPNLVPAATVPQTRGPGYIEMDVPPGDVRLWDDNIFAPWDEDGKKAGGVYYARSGRSETRALMPFEIVPVTAGGTRFTVIFDGKPVAKQAVTLVSPDRWMLALETDAQGQVELPLREKGRYIVKAEMKEEGDFTLSSGDVQIVSRITTTSFVVP